ncbi:hypothetical protein NEF87_004558 [Candidatus Lokiarchaeum ossiferum]|uniref:Uncharacterized protein n=1 Tax=Candidatus Lokiarchaeum ossiferum TaxID=2951803 RepID=A0ABY6HY15_9ARCH|nr:hypothetical protein NEF87_004558 [Candidatus Lokiarchaeum sp. B-35]
MERAKIFDNLPNLETVLELYINLCGKPEPEEEEEAQKNLVPIFNQWLENIKENDGYYSDIQEIYNMISNWDTLESWFFEIPFLKQKLGEFLLIFYPKNEQLNQIFAPVDKKPNENNIVHTEESFQKSDLKAPIVDLDSNSVQDVKKNTLELNFQKQILTNSIDVEKQTKIEKRLQEMEKRMADLMEKEGRVKVEDQIKPSPPLNEMPQIQQYDSDTKLHPPKFNIPNVPKPKKKVTPNNNNIIPDITEISKEQKKLPIPIKITPQVPFTPEEENIIDINDNEGDSKYKIQNIETNISIQNSPEIVPLQYVPSSKNNISSNAIRITNIDVSSHIIRPEQDLNQNISPKIEQIKYLDNKLENENLIESSIDVFKEIISLESKKYYLEQQMKELEKNVSGGLMSAENYQLQISKYNSELFNFSTHIEKLRSKILD